MAEKTSMIGWIDLSGKVVISDPCYDRNKWYVVKDIAVKPGKYAICVTQIDMEEYGVVIAAIMAVHTDYFKSLKAEWNPYDCVIGVDSGQCGIFDDTIYPAYEKSGGEYDDENSFYGECCKLTLSDAKSGILRTRGGAVSSSGHGDGSYELFCQYHDGERIALMVNFGIVNNDTIMKTLDRNGFHV